MKVFVSVSMSDKELEHIHCVWGALHLQALGSVVGLTFALYLHGAGPGAVQVAGD